MTIDPFDPNDEITIAVLKATLPPPPQPEPKPITREDLLALKRKFNGEDETDG